MLSEQTITYGAVWLFGALAALAKSVRDSDYHDPWRAAGGVACGGFVAFSVVGIASQHLPSHFDSRVYSMSVAIFVGLSGKSIDWWLRYLASLTSRLKIPPPPEPQ